MAQWGSICHACEGPWVRSLSPHKRPLNKQTPPFHARTPAVIKGGLEPKGGRRVCCQAWKGTAKKLTEDPAETRASVGAKPDRRQEGEGLSNPGYGWHHLR